MFYLSEPGVSCALGNSSDELRRALVVADRGIPQPASYFEKRGKFRVAGAPTKLACLSDRFASFECRNNRLAVSVLEQLVPDIEAAIDQYGPSRIGVVMGTSTSGIAQTEEAVKRQLCQRQYPSAFHAAQGVLGGLAEFTAAYLGTTGPSYTVSTACASSASAVLSARRLLSLGLCDAVIVGGVDSLCEMTLQGFSALEALSASLSKPFSRNRDGINLGEAGTAFLLSREPSEVMLLGGAASSDAHHMSAPHPEGAGAFNSMAAALLDADLDPNDIDYLNLHGTGTIQNDKMESKAVNMLFGDSLYCSSTKSMTGHTLGASGALELAICWLLVTQSENWRLPPSLYLDEQDPDLAAIRLTDTSTHTLPRPKTCLSNSFAFGGSNVSLIIGRDNV